MSVPKNALAQSEVCRGLTDGEIRTIHALSEELSIGEQQVLFREGDAGDGVYLVLSGELEIAKRDHAGKERPLATIGQGAVVGEMSLVQAGAPRSATVRTLGPTTLLKVPAQRFQSLLQQDAVAALKVVRNLARVLSQRLARLDQRVLELMAQTDGTRHEELSDFQKLLQNWSF